MVNRLLLPGAILLFLVLVLTTALLVQFAANERHQQGWVVHTYQVVSRLQRILMDAQDAETGQRGYIITRDPSFLGPYREGTARIDRDVDAFRALTVDNPRQQERAGALRAITVERLGALDKGLTAAPSRPVSPVLLAAMKDGRRQMERLRSVVAAGIADENELLGQRLAARAAAEAREIATAIVAGILALAILLGAALIMIRNNIRLSRSETQRANEAAILQGTLDTVREGVAVFDRCGKLRAFNQAFFRQLDFPETLAVVGTDLEAFRAIDAHRSQPVFAEWPPVSGRPDETYQRVLLNERALDVYRAAVPGGSFLVASTEVTARVRAEATVRQAQKMEAVGQLTGGAAHDFNNLLQIISANLDLIAADTRDNGKVAERLHNVMAAVERGSRLTGQLLAFARKQALEPRTINLGRLVQDMTDLLRRTLGEQVEVEAVIAGGLWNTQIDPTQVENAVLNLAINARDAMPGGGKLTIELANAFLDDAYAAANEDVAAGQYVMLAVTDTGGGMTSDVAQRAFEPFFTTKEEGRGTGLGLSQVYGFVKQSGGHIKIYSEVGQGTTVKLYLPRTRKSEEVQEPVLTSRAVEGGNETVLVVEDDEGVRSAVTDMLAELGYSTLRAGNAEQALVLLESGAQIDLLFTDVVMPGPIPTPELARRARALHPDIAVLFTSGYTRNAIVHNGKLDADVMLISKPYRKDELARKLRVALSARRKDRGTEAPMAPASTSAGGASATVSGDRRKALVVEDVALIRMSTVDMVEQLGFETLEAGDGTQALAIFKADEAIDLLVTDLGLPGLSGRQLIEEARAIRPRLRVIVTTGYTNSDETGARIDGVTYLMKPFDLELLRRALEV